MDCILHMLVVTKCNILHKFEATHVQQSCHVYAVSLHNILVDHSHTKRVNI